MATATGDLVRPVVIELSKPELWDACDVGARRKAMHRFALAKGEKRLDTNQQRGGKEKDPWNEVESGCAEYAACKYLRRWWPRDWWSHRRTVDIPPDIEVRWTEHFEHGHLLLYDEDKPQYRYVLVVGTMPTYHLLGWTYGRDGMQARFYRSPTPDRPKMFMVPRTELRPVSELLRFDGDDES